MSGLHAGLHTGLSDPLIKGSHLQGAVPTHQFQHLHDVSSHFLKLPVILIETSKFELKHFDRANNLIFIQLILLWNGAAPTPNFSRYYL